MPTKARDRKFNLKTKQGWKQFILLLLRTLKALGRPFKYAWYDTFIK